MNNMPRPQRLTRFGNIQAKLCIAVIYSPDPHENEYSQKFQKNGISKLANDVIENVSSASIHTKQTSYFVYGIC